MYSLNNLQIDVLFSLRMTWKKQKNKKTNHFQENKWAEYAKVQKMIKKKIKNKKQKQKHTHTHRKDKIKKTHKNNKKIISPLAPCSI